MSMPPSRSARGDTAARLGGAPALAGQTTPEEVQRNAGRGGVLRPGARQGHLPVHVLKVDKSFIDHVTTARQDTTVTGAILAMSRSMDLTTVADGVDQPEQAAWRDRARCAHAQGYLWSKPAGRRRRAGAAVRRAA